MSPSMAASSQTEQPFRDGSPSPDETIQIEVPTNVTARHLLRATLILDMAREPGTIEEFHMKLAIPQMTAYRIVRDLTSLGWLRACGYRRRAGTRGAVRPARLYVSTSPRLPMHPHACGNCRVILYSIEQEAHHRCR